MGENLMSILGALGAGSGKGGSSNPLENVKPAISAQFTADPYLQGALFDGDGGSDGNGIGDALAQAYAGFINPKKKKSSQMAGDLASGGFDLSSGVA